MLAAPFWISLLLADPTPAAVVQPAGFRHPLAVGRLFVPEGLQAADGPIGLIVHLHGARDLLERKLAQSQIRAVLVTVSLNGLSSVYTKQFAAPQTFLNLLEEAAIRTGPAVGAERVEFGQVLVSSFSAGFGGVRELLNAKSPDCYRRIDALVMADSIYAGYLGDARERGVDPERMSGFLRFAKDAAAGRKKMVISHCQLQPETYASTAETADYVLRQLNLQRQECDAIWAEQWQNTSRCEQAGLHVFGFSGSTGSDHMRHLHNIERLWNVASR
jgi:hypothetical protein